MSLGVGIRHLKDLNNPDGPNLRIHIRICVQITHVYVHARSQDEIFD